MGLKERLSCALTIPAGHEIDSEAVSSAVDSVPYLNRQKFSVSPNLDEPSPSEGILGKFLLLLFCYAWDSENEAVYSSTIRT